MRKIAIYTASALLLSSQLANAQGVDPLIEGAKLCTRHLKNYEREYGIPAHLLSAIASTESGRYHKGLRIKLPWPWTINAEGKGYFFDTKEQAIAAARNLQMRGVQSMDVGCMQVNLYHHANAFTSLNQAFEPENNVAYAAGFLRSLYQEEGNWKSAAADYHSKTPVLGSRYVGLVYSSWYNIVDRLRSARLAVPDSAFTGLRQMASNTPTSAQKSATVAGTVKPLPTPKKFTISDNGVSKVASMKPLVQRQYSKSGGVIVVRPEIKVVEAGSKDIPERNLPPEPMVIASASQTPATLPVPAVRPKVVNLENNSTSQGSPLRKAGPNFIFND